MTSIEPRARSALRWRDGEGRAEARRWAGLSLVVACVILAIAATLVGLWLVRETIVWLVAAGFLAFSIEPLVQMFQRRGLGRGASTTVAFALQAAGMLVFAIAILPAVAKGAAELADKIPAYVDQLQATSASDTLNADAAISTAGDVAQ